MYEGRKVSSLLMIYCEPKTSEEHCTDEIYTPDGFFMFLLQMGLAQREVDVLRQRTSGGMETKLRAVATAMV